MAELKAELSPEVLAVKKMAATEKPLLDMPLVLWHGWGCDSAIWEPVLNGLNQFAELWLIDLPGFGKSAPLDRYTVETNAGVDNLCAELLPYLPRQGIYLGWSLGGMLATRIAAMAPQRVAGLITLAVNASFIARAQWPDAMSETTFSEFSHSFFHAPQNTLKRFISLEAMGDIREREIVKWLRNRLPAGEAECEHWKIPLGLLQRFDNRQALSSLAQPVLHILGENDALVPCRAANKLRELNSQHDVEILADTSHAIPVSRPEKTVELVYHFMQQVRNNQVRNNQVCNIIDKQKIADSFSRAAATYDAVAKLQRKIGEHLLQKLASANGLSEYQDKNTVLDLGCGTGHFTRKLVKLFPQAQVMGLDIAKGMLSYACSDNSFKSQWVCGDAEQLPLKTDSVETVFSSLAIQWCQHPAVLFQELCRILKPGGQIFFATLGPGTLEELRQAWQQVDDYIHVNEFVAEESVRQALSESDLVLQGWETESITLHYAQLRDLTRELKSIGAHNMNAGQNSGLTGRRRIQALCEAYECFRDEGMLPATYEVYYGVVRKCCS